MAFSFSISPTPAQFVHCMPSSTALSRMYRLLSVWSEDDFKAALGGGGPASSGKAAAGKKAAAAPSRAEPPAKKAKTAAAASARAKPTPRIPASNGVPEHLEPVTPIDLTGYNYGSAPTGAEAELDLVFALDCTASMGSTIAACKRDIQALATALRSQRGLDVRFALVPYRDHGVTEEFCTKVYPFTRDLEQMQSNVDGQQPGGGGDAPEAVTAALFECVCLEWRPSAAKQVSARDGHRLGADHH